MANLGIAQSSLTGPTSGPPGPPGPSGTTAFASLTSGTNVVADMTVGEGASLQAAGTGVINATEVNGVPILGTPGDGDVAVFDASLAAAVWSPAIVDSGGGTFAIDDGLDGAPGNFDFDDGSF